MMEESGIKEINKNLIKLYSSASDSEKEEMLEFFKPSEGKMLPAKEQVGGTITIKLKVK